MDIDEGAGSARREQAEVDTALVERARADDPDAFGELYERWFERVYDLSYRITRDSSTAAEVAQDAFLAAWRQLGRLERPDAFGGWLLRVTRNTAFNRVRKERRSSPLDAEGMAMIESDGPRANAPAGFGVEDRAGTLTDPARVAEDREVVDLVWESAEALGTNDAEVLDLTLRHGLTPAEIGDVIGVNRNAANQAVHRVRKRLRVAVEARVLWRGGEPVCGDLADALAAASVTKFDSDAVRITEAHVETCEQCAERRRFKLEPSAMFAATPFIAAPLVKQQIAHALSVEGVPLGTFGASGEAATEESAGAPSRGGQRRVLARVLAGVAAVILVLVAVSVVLAEDTDEAGLRARRADATRESTAPSTTVPATSLTIPIEGSIPTSAPRVVTPPPAPELPPPPPPLPVTGSISIGPSSSSGSVFLRPTLSWSTADAVSVEVSGPGGFSSTQPNGSASVCPGSPLGPDCNAPPGSYTYTLRATDSSGAVVLVRTATFTVG
jgi:RNA polymerase sigma factor (sigma-70 family)